MLGENSCIVLYCLPLKRQVKSFHDNWKDRLSKAVSRICDLQTILLTSQWTTHHVIKISNSVPRLAQKPIPLNMLSVSHLHNPHILGPTSSLVMHWPLTLVSQPLTVGLAVVVSMAMGLLAWTLKMFCRTLIHSSKFLTQGDIHRWLAPLSCL